MTTIWQQFEYHPETSLHTAWSCLAISQFGLQFWTDVWPGHCYNCF